MNKFGRTTANNLHSEKTAVDLDGDILLTACGDVEAFERIYAATNNAVFGFALSVVKNRHDAEDVMHDVYVQVYNAAAGYNPTGKPLAWIFKITKNLCLKKLRNRKYSADNSEVLLENMLSPDSTLSTEDRIFMSELLKTLSDTEREIVVLHAYSGFKHREIAEVLDLALPTVLSKYNRALAKLRKKL